MENIYHQTLLYDFYGELLTEHQRRIYEDAVYNDLSLGEIAKEYGISRQGVHDLIRRCDHILQGYEEKLHLVARYGQARMRLEEIRRLTEDAVFSGLEDAAGEKLSEIRKALEELEQEF